MTAIKINIKIVINS